MLTGVMQIGEAAIRDTVAAVFRAPEFNRTHAPPLLVRLVWWILDRLSELRALTAASPALYDTLLGVAATVVAALVARVVYLWYVQRSGEAGRSGPRTAARESAVDPWLLAQHCAAAGDFTAAAHHLYAAILHAVARAHLVRLHPSKTIGDYVRELRSRASTAVLTPFREFARVYEVVIYGTAACDRDRYERLRALAGAIVARET